MAYPPPNPYDSTASIPEAYGSVPVPKADDPVATFSLAVANFVNRAVIGHPCTVLRRQCQVHQFATKLHLTPFSLVPVACYVVGKDGVLTLWKGSTGAGVLFCLQQVVEIVIADVFGLPRTIVTNGSTQKFWRHVSLQAWTIFATTPFIVSSFIETVRSSTGFGTGEAGFLEIVTRGLDRLRFDMFGAKDSSRRFTVLYLTAPTVGFYTARFLVSKAAFSTIYNMARSYVGRKPPASRTRFHAILPDMFATISSSFLADVICYPFETVLHRMYIQGTRTLIDNLDNGVSAVSITAKYGGFFNCFRSITKHEGWWALYSGIGAVFLQYGLQFLVLRAINAIFNHSANALRIATSPPTVRRSGPNSGNVLGYGGPPSAQFAAAGGHAEDEKGGNPFFGHHSPNATFPSFAQTQAGGAFGAEPTPFGPTYSTFHETDCIPLGNYFGGSASPPRFPSLVTSPRDRFDANGDGLLQPLTDVPLGGLETSKSTPRF